MAGENLETLGSFTHKPYPGVAFPGPHMSTPSFRAQVAALDIGMEGGIWGWIF